MRVASLPNLGWQRPGATQLDSDTIQRYYKRVNSRHRKTLERIFATPVQANIPWQEIESLFIALGAEIYEGSGSRVRILLNGVVATFHRPHPQKETDKGAIVRVRVFLRDAGVKP